MSDSNHKTVLITGAAGNLGRATSLAFAAQGAQLVLADHNQDRLLSLAAELPPGCRHQTIPVNLIDPEAVIAMRDQALARFGQIDTLANIAGGFRMGPLLQDTPDKDWDFMMDLNLRSVFNCCRALLPGMVERGSGRIINISARAAVAPKGRMGPYCASKAAVNVVLHINCSRRNEVVVQFRYVPLFEVGVVVGFCAVHQSFQADEFGHFFTLQNVNRRLQTVL